MFYPCFTLFLSYVFSFHQAIFFTNLPSVEVEKNWFSASKTGPVLQGHIKVALLCYVSAKQVEITSYRRSCPLLLVFVQLCNQPCQESISKPTWRKIREHNGEMIFLQIRTKICLPKQGAWDSAGAQAGRSWSWQLPFTQHTYINSKYCETKVLEVNN